MTGSGDGRTRPLVRTMLVGASELVRSALRVALAVEDVTVVVACDLDVAGDLDADCRRALGSGQVDVALLMPAPAALSPGLQLSQRIRAQCPRVGLVVLAAPADPRLFEPPLPVPPPGTLRLDADATNDVGRLATALRLARYPTGVRSSDPDPRVALTDTQAEVLRLLATGHSNQGIADRRGVSVKAVERVVQRLTEELEVPTGGEHNSRVLLTRAHAALLDRAHAPLHDQGYAASRG